MRAAGIRPAELAAIGITNQRETTVLWERATGRPVAPRDRLAGPAHRRALPRAARRAASAPAPGSCPTRTSPRRSSSGCSREPSSLAARARVRHRRLVARLEADGRPRARHRPDERVPDDAARPATRSTGTTNCSTLFGVDRRCSRGSSARRRSSARRELLGARCRSRGSPATSRPRCSATAASTAGEAKATYGTGSFVLVHAGAERAPRAGRAARDRGCLGRLRVRGRDLGERRGDPVAARRARDPRRRRGERARWRASVESTRRRLVRAGVRRPRLAALERGGARADQRDHARHDAGAARACGARGDRVPGRGRPRRCCPAASRCSEPTAGRPRTGF